MDAKWISIGEYHKYCQNGTPVLAMHENGDLSKIEFKDYCFRFWRSRHIAHDLMCFMFLEMLPPKPSSYEHKPKLEWIDNKAEDVDSR